MLCRSIDLLYVCEWPLRAFFDPSELPLPVPCQILLPQRLYDLHSLPFWELLPCGKQCWHSMRCSGIGPPLIMPLILVGCLLTLVADCFFRLSQGRYSPSGTLLSAASQCTTVACPSVIMLRVI